MNGHPGGHAHPPGLVLAEHAVRLSFRDGPVRSADRQRSTVGNG